MSECAFTDFQGQISISIHHLISSSSLYFMPKDLKIIPIPFPSSTSCHPCINPLLFLLFTLSLLYIFSFPFFHFHFFLFSLSFSFFSFLSHFYIIYATIRFNSLCEDLMETLLKTDTSLHAELLAEIQKELNVDLNRAKSSQKKEANDDVIKARTL